MVKALQGFMQMSHKRGAPTVIFGKLGKYLIRIYVGRIACYSNCGPSFN